MNLDTRARRAAQGIDRAVEAMETMDTEPRAVARFDRFRARKERNRRIGAIAVAASLVVASLLLVTTRALDRGKEAVPGDPDGSTAPTYPPQIGTAVQSSEGCATDYAIEQGHLDGLTLVNETDRPAGFDLARFSSTDLSFAAFEAHVERERRRAEVGKPSLDPAEGVKVEVQASVRPGETRIIDEAIPPGRYAIVCLRPFAGAGMRPFAIAGPVVFE